MDGFVELESDVGHGVVWVRLAHVTGIRVLEIHELNGATHHALSVLAGGEWFSDRIDHPTAADAAARADVLAGLVPAGRVGGPHRGRLAHDQGSVTPCWRIPSTPHCTS